VRIAHAAVSVTQTCVAAPHGKPPHVGATPAHVPATQLPLQQSLGAPHVPPSGVHGEWAAHVIVVGSQIALQHSVQLAHETPFAEQPVSELVSIAFGPSLLESNAIAASSLARTIAASTFASTGLPASSRGGA
jgi:hypothetical protein